MNKYVYKGELYTVAELADKAGFTVPQLRARLRKYSVEDAIKAYPTDTSVDMFCEDSYWEDWVGTSSADLYKIYWKWCISMGYEPLSHQNFSRQVFSKYPNLKIVPMRDKYGNSYRMIRER